MDATAAGRIRPDKALPGRIGGETAYSGRKRTPHGGNVKRWMCALLVLALTGCIPIGFRSQNLPYAGVNPAPTVHPAAWA